MVVFHINVYYVLTAYMNTIQIKYVKESLYFFFTFIDCCDTLFCRSNIIFNFTYIVLVDHFCRITITKITQNINLRILQFKKP